MGKWRTRLVDGWKAAFGSGIRFKELLIELAWLPKQDSAGAVYSFCNLCKKKIADRSSHDEPVDHTRNQNSAAGFRRLNFPVSNRSVTDEVKQKLSLQLKLYYAAAQQQLLIIYGEVFKKRAKAAQYYKFSFVADNFVYF